MFKKRKAAAQFNNVKIESHGISFSSKLEAATYEMLLLRVKAGEYKSIQVQDYIYMTDARILYIPDFKCELSDESGFDWHESKGYESALWPTKKRLWRHYGPGKLFIWKGNWRKPVLSETVVPVLKPHEPCEDCSGLKSKGYIVDY